jgi:hypothetical protein
MYSLLNFALYPDFSPVFSANYLQSSNPNPEPFSLAVPSTVTLVWSWNSLFIVSSFIPTPSSEIVISMQLFFL